MLKMDEIKLTYRKGYLTEKSFKELISAYFGDDHYMLHISSYKHYYGATWNRTQINDKIPGFVEYLQSQGVKVLRVREYSSPTNGSLTLAPR